MHLSASLSRRSYRIRALSEPLSRRSYCIRARFPRRSRAAATVSACRKRIKDTHCWRWISGQKMWVSLSSYMSPVQQKKVEIHKGIIIQ